MQLYPQPLSYVLHAQQERVRNWTVGWVDENRKDGCSWQQLVQQLQALWSNFDVQVEYPGDVATRTIEADNESSCDRVGRDAEQIGIVVVAAFAAKAEGVPPAATITVT